MMFMSYNTNNHSQLNFILYVIKYSNVSKYNMFYKNGFIII